MSELYFTIQPHSSLKDKQKQILTPYLSVTYYKKQIMDHFGYYPIFCKPFKDCLRMWFDSLTIFPNSPEVLIIFEADDVDQVAISEVYKIFNDDSYELDFNNKSTPVEYFVPQLPKENIRYTVDLIKDLDDLDPYIVGLNYTQVCLDATLYLEACKQIGEEPIFTESFDEDTINILADCWDTFAEKLIKYDFDDDYYNISLHNFLNTLKQIKKKM